MDLKELIRYNQIIMLESSFDCYREFSFLTDDICSGQIIFDKNSEKFRCSGIGRDIMEYIKPEMLESNDGDSSDRIFQNIYEFMKNPYL